MQHTPKPLFKNLASITIFEDEDIIALNKPSRLLTIPDREQSEKSLKEYLQEKFGQIFVIHRLDKDTSGIVLFAKNETAHKYFSKSFEERKVEKYYTGIVIGQPSEQSGDIEAPIAEHPVKKGTMYVHRNGKASHTGFEVLEESRFFSLLQFRLYTGRTHQIRVHAKEIGHPLAADPIYGDGKPVLLSSIKKKYNLSKKEETEQPIINRLALHAHKLVFEKMNGDKLELIAPNPKEFKALMQQLKKA